MDRDNEHIVTDESMEHAMDGLQQMESMSEEEWKVFLADKEALSDASLLAGYKEAKQRKEAPLPDAGKAWQSFHSAQIAPVQERRRRHIGAWIYASTAVAAVLAVVFILKFTQFG